MTKQLTNEEKVMQFLEPTTQMKVKFEIAETIIEILCRDNPYTKESGFSTRLRDSLFKKLSMRDLANLEFLIKQKREFKDGQF